VHFQPAVGGEYSGGADIRHKPGYVPFRIGAGWWALLALLVVVASSGFALFIHWSETSGGNEYTSDDLSFSVIAAAVVTSGLWGALQGLRFAFHLVDCRHKTGKQRNVGVEPSAETPAEPAYKDTWSGLGVFLVRALWQEHRSGRHGGQGR
jgi:hypothetical protein